MSTIWRVQKKTTNQMKIYNQLRKLKFMRTLYSGTLAAVIIFLGTYFTGKLGPAEAKVSIEEMKPSLRFICSSTLTATSTILALLLTLLSFSSSTERNIKAEHFDRVKWIARLSTIAFAGAIFLLMFLNLPLKNNDLQLDGFYQVTYYVLLSYGALLGGLMISVVLMLYRAAKAIILIYHPNRDADFLFVSQQQREAIEAEKEQKN